jgi:ribosome-associated protein
MEETVKEKSLQHEAAALAEAAPKTSFSELDETLKLALECASEKKGINITALDLREIASFADFFVIATGLNTRQVQAISNEIEEQLKKRLQTKTLRIEGYPTAEWVLMDYGDFIVHIFEKDARGFYDLERLWSDAKRVDLPEGL